MIIGIIYLLFKFLFIFSPRFDQKEIEAIKLSSILRGFEGEISECPTIGSLIEMSKFRYGGEGGKGGRVNKR